MEEGEGKREKWERVREGERIERERDRERAKQISNKTKCVSVNQTAPKRVNEQN